MGRGDCVLRNGGGRILWFLAFRIFISFLVNEERIGRLWLDIHGRRAGEHWLGAQRFFLFAIRGHRHWGVRERVFLIHFAEGNGAPI